MKNGKTWLVIIGVVLAFFIILGMFGSNDDKYEDTLKSGLNKYYSGQEMNEQEYKAVKGYNDWKAKQGNKTYQQWDN